MPCVFGWMTTATIDVSKPTFTQPELSIRCFQFGLPSSAGIGFASGSVSGRTNNAAFLPEHLQDFHLSTPDRVQRNTDADEDSKDERTHISLVVVSANVHIIL